MRSTSNSSYAKQQGIMFLLKDLPQWHVLQTKCPKKDTRRYYHTVQDHTSYNRWSWVHKDLSRHFPRHRIDQPTDHDGHKRKVWDGALIRPKTTIDTYSTSEAVTEAETNSYSVNCRNLSYLETNLQAHINLFYCTAVDHIMIRPVLPLTYFIISVRPTDRKLTKGHQLYCCTNRKRRQCVKRHT